ILVVHHRQFPRHQPEGFSDPRVTPLYKQHKNVLGERLYIETMEEVMKKSTKVFLDSLYDKASREDILMHSLGGKLAMSGRLWIALIALVAVVGWLVLSIFFTVDETQQALVLRFGKPVA